MANENESCGCGDESCSVPTALTNEQWQELQTAIKKMPSEDRGTLMLMAGAEYLVSVGTTSALVTTGLVSAMVTVNPSTRHTLDGLRRLMNGE